MVAFEKDQARFNYRVAGVAIQNGRVLLDQNSRNTYWVLPGGHPEMMEPMADALQREIREEAGVDARVVRLLWIMENFFHKNKEIHELSFYFLMEIDPSAKIMKSDGPFYGVEGRHQLTFRWFPLDELSLRGLPLMPGSLPGLLMGIPASPQHIVFHDSKKTQASKVDNLQTFP